MKVQLWSVWIELIVAETEKWKHCSKIIFKCVNSVVGPIFNIFKFINSAATVCEQWFLSLYSKFMWFYCSCVEKKKKKTQNVEIEIRKMRNSNGYYVF